MSVRVIEGTWEEIERHKSELEGHNLRVMIIPEQPAPRRPNLLRKKAPIRTKSHCVSAMGKYAGVLNLEDFMRQKQEEIDFEDGPRQQ